MSYRVGFDIGGTKIEAALLRFTDSTFEVIFRRRVPTDREKGYASILEKIKSLYHQVLEHLPENSKIESVGLGLPGSIDPKTHVMHNGNTNAFVGQNLKKDFTEIFSGISKIKWANDANCFALAEARYGVGLEHEKSHPGAIAVGIILGTGCGGGLIIGDHFIEGKNGAAGEIGHTILIPNGRPCFCGRRGCAETYISGTGLEIEYSEVSGKPLGASNSINVFEKANAGEAFAKIAILNYKQHLAEFLANMTNIFDPDYFVLGGGVSQQASIYEGLEKTIRSQRLIPVESPRVYQNKLGDSAGVIGAALL